MAEHFSSDGKKAETPDSVSTAGTKSAADAADGTNVPPFLNTSSTPAAQEKKPSIALKVVLIVVGILVAIYVGFLVFFSSHFIPNTKVGDIDASWLTVDELAKKVDATAAEYRNSVDGDGVSLTLSAQDLGLAVDGQAFAADAFSLQQAASWPVVMIQGASITPKMTATIDEQKTVEKVRELVAAHNETAEAPTNAYITYNGDAHEFQIVNEVLGKQVSPEAVAAQVSASAELLNDKTELGEDALLRPRYVASSSAMQDACAKANELVKCQITLVNEGAHIYDLNSDLISQWIQVLYDWDIDGIAALTAEPEQTDEGEGDDWDEEEESEVAPWDEPDTDLGFAYTDESGARVNVRVSRPNIRAWSFLTLNDIVNGEDESRVWEVNSWDTAGIIKDALNEGRTGDLQVATMIVEQRPPETEGHEARGRHIDINLTTQYARMYDTDGKTVLWRSYIVSGQDGRYNTPTGEFEIESRALDIVMVGDDEDGDGEPDYRTPCTFWMGFYGGYGIHDSWWRSNYGDDIYTWWGSHGCVNVSYEKAEQLWNLTDYGDKVYIHY